ncbi:MAG TPA: hypothetical protein VGF55_07845 [Gemmataceae bacterium]|jgi:hypothetical protein
MKCRHCEKAPVNRPRGLCWSCYYTPGVRDLYPSTSKFARRGVGNFCGNAAAAAAPTEALPGSPEKIAILEERARQRQELWHPQDATLDRPALPPLVLRAG